MSWSEASGTALLDVNSKGSLARETIMLGRPAHIACLDLSLEHSLSHASSLGALASGRTLRGSDWTARSSTLGSNILDLLNLAFTKSGSLVQLGLEFG